MTPRRLLRLEGAAVFLFATAAFVMSGGAPWLYVVVVVIPDLSMAGYVVNDTVGARLYNTVHTFLGPLLLAVTGLVLGRTVMVQIALPWIAHIGIDRALRHGLKYDTAFKDTHMQRL